MPIRTGLVAMPNSPSRTIKAIATRGLWEECRRRRDEQHRVGVPCAEAAAEVPHQSLQWTLDAVTAGPAFVRNGRMDLLAVNAGVAADGALLQTRVRPDPGAWVGVLDCPGFLRSNVFFDMPTLRDPESLKGAFTASPVNEGLLHCA
jgi:hypothetical protein